MIVGQTKNTLGDILKWLQAMDGRHPEDAAYILDIMNIISHHVKLISELKKVNALEVEVATQNISDVLFKK